MGSRDGAVVKGLASHQCDPGPVPAWCHMWIEFVVGSRRCSEGFSPGSPVFLPPNSNLEDPHDVAFSLNIVLYLFKTYLDRVYHHQNIHQDRYNYTSQACWCILLSRGSR